MLPKFQSLQCGDINLIASVDQLCNRLANLSSSAGRPPPASEFVWSVVDRNQEFHCQRFLFSWQPEPAILCRDGNQPKQLPHVVSFLTIHPPHASPDLSSQLNILILIGYIQQLFPISPGHQWSVAFFCDGRNKHTLAVRHDQRVLLIDTAEPDRKYHHDPQSKYSHSEYLALIQ